MRLILICTFLTILSINAKTQTLNLRYDKTLADSLGADIYGMKSYVLVILKTGSNKTDNKAMIDSLFKEHIANINRLAALGKLVVAGPFKKNDKAYRGIFILNVKSIEEANVLLATDPAFREKLLDAELYQWYGSAALGEYLKTHEKIEKNRL